MTHTIPEFITSIVDDGFSPQDIKTKQLYHEVAKFARQGQSIVIFGPTGAGKEFLARHYYKTLISAEFYQQYKENWPSKFNEIRNHYAGCYSGQSLDIFLNSIRAGSFHSINSATIYPNLAESILFGHEANAFTGAVTYPGLLESIKYGVLFMDEIGELTKDLQAKLLRAMDPSTYEGSRLAGKMNYSLNDIIIISATNQPRDTFRDDFFYRIGFEVEIKGIDERPKDVCKAIPYFICKAIGKRKDYAAVISMFGIRGLQNINKLSEAEEVKNFATEHSDYIANIVLTRKWPGNFRALRIAIEASIFQIESTNHIDSFTKEFRKNLYRYIEQYSVNPLNTYTVGQKSVSDAIFPSLNANQDQRILDKFINEHLFQDVEDIEQKILSVFLSSNSKSGFKRRDLEKFYKSHKAIRFTSEAHIRSRINKLLDLDILRRTGEGKSTRYFLAKNFLDSLFKKDTDIFALPKTKKNRVSRKKEIDMLDKVLHASERIYIQSQPQQGKTTFITLFCNAKDKLYNFYYYPLGEAGIEKFFEDIRNFLQSENVPLKDTQLPRNDVNNIHPFLEKLFKTKDGNKPVLIFDNAQFISDHEETKTITDLSDKWQEIILILIGGDKMDNALLDDFYEFQLDPWNRQA